jgi:hypothetical protein
MSVRLSKSYIASLSFAALVGSWAGAKPPDLPSASREAVAPQVEQIPLMPLQTTAKAQPAKADDGRPSGARRLYLIGERCRRTGDLDMAVNCYHEVDLLSPHGPYGRKARRRLHAIELQRISHPTSGDAEEQEAPLPMPRFVPRENITIELESVQRGLDTAPASSSAPVKIPVLRVPLPPRNLTIYVEEPESYGR